MWPSAVTAAMRGPDPTSRSQQPLLILLGVLLGHAALLEALPLATPTAAASATQRVSSAQRLISVRVLPDTAAPAPSPRPPPRPPPRPATPSAPPSEPPAEPTPRPLAPAARATPSGQPAQPANTLDPAAQTQASRPAQTSSSAQPAVPAPAADSDWPAYTARLPAGFQLALRARRLQGAPGESAPRAEEASGHLRWSRLETGEYTLALELGAGPRPWLEMRSVGRSDALGLTPVRFTDRRGGRGWAAANIEAAQARVRYSAQAGAQPVAAVVQDRLSWLVQLPAAVRAEPALQRDGARIVLQVVGVRGPAQRWVFECRRMAPAAASPPSAPSTDLAQADTATPRSVTAPLQHCRREPTEPYDNRVEIWLDPARDWQWQRVLLTHLPLGHRLEFAPHEDGPPSAPEAPGKAGP
jgi:hypothetical protein